MARTKASAAASISSRTRSRRLQFEPQQFTQDPESGMDSDMEEAAAEGPSPEVRIALVGGPGPEAPVADGSNAIDLDDADLVYDHTRFRKYKAYRRFTDDYRGRRVVVERGLIVTDFDERAPRIRAVLEAQGRAAMVEDHRPAIVELVREFYTNLHRRAGDSFFTWVRGMEIHVTPDLVSAITGAPRVRAPEYPWPVDHLLTRAKMVACFAEGRPHHMETEGESSFQVHNFSNEVRCIYRVVMSHVLPVLSLTMITMDRARCLYALLTETSIDYGSVVTVAMMSVRHANSCITLPYRALITWIVQHVRVDTEGTIELAPEKGPITARYLNASNAHLRDAAPTPRPRRKRTARVDGASTSASKGDRLGRIETKLKAYGRAMASLTQTVQELQDHLMGPLDVRDYGIHNSHFSHGRGSPSARGSLSAQGNPGGRVSPNTQGMPGRGPDEQILRRRSHS
jgi:hypothetical protein